MATRGVAPTIAELHRQADDIVQRVLTENAGRWETASQRDRARIEAMARAVANRILHEPTIRLRSLDPAAGHRRVELLRELFVPGWRVGRHHESADSLHPPLS